MKKLTKKDLTKRELMVALATRPCFCGCGCNSVCSCPPIPTHQIGIDQMSDGKVMSQESVSSGETSRGSDLF